MGIVFAATHTSNGSAAAIKVLRSELSRDSGVLSRFLQEGYAANHVNHPGVVRILDSNVTEEGLAYLVMELLEGEPLERRRVRKGGRLPLVEVYEIAEQLLDVLAAAHAKGIVHRDIKPDNLFLTRQGRVKVLDFGFAQMKTGLRAEQTATGFLLGTPGFMAPEQAAGQRSIIDAQTDLWAVGATLFLLLTGQPVHDGESAAELLVAAANYPARSISKVEPGLPTKLRSIVDRALAFDKSQRWPDARSMQLALRNVPGWQPVAEPTPERSRWGRSVPDVDGEDARSRASIDESMMVGIEDQGLTLAPDSDGVMVAARASVDPIADTVALSSADALSTQNVTMVMESRPRPAPPSRLSAAPPRRSTPDVALFGGERGSRAPFVAAAAPLEPGGRVSQVLSLVLVAGVTMVVVILTGLLVILGSD